MAAGSNNIVTDGLIACWDAGNRRSYPGSPGTATTWTDLVNSNNATLENMVGESNSGFDPQKGGVIEFDGTDAYCLVGKKTQLDWGSGDGSLAAWYRTSSTANQHIVGNGSSNPGGKRYVLLYGGFEPEALTFDIDDNGTNKYAYIDRGGSEDDQWHYAVGMREGTNVHLYLDGLLVDTTAIGSYGSLDDTYGFLIGGLYNALDGSIHHFFDGYIAVVHSYNRALSAAEVKQNYETMKPRFKPRITKSGLVASWDAGDPQSYTSGDIWKDTANSANGELENDTSFSAAGGGSFAFDGTDDYVNIPYNSVLDVTSVSILAWVKVDGDNSHYDDIFRKDYNPGNSHSYGIQVAPNGSFAFNIRVASGTSGLDSGEDLSDDTWTFIAGTYDGTTMRTYKDDSVGATSTSVSGDLVSSADIALIGASKRSSNTEMKGNIASVRIYNRALSAAEILDNYNKTKGRFGY